MCKCWKVRNDMVHLTLSWGEETKWKNGPKWCQSMHHTRGHVKDAGFHTKGKGRWTTKTGLSCPELNYFLDLKPILDPQLLGCVSYICPDPANPSSRDFDVASSITTLQTGSCWLSDRGSQPSCAHGWLRLPGVGASLATPWATGRWTAIPHFHESLPLFCWSLVLCNGNRKNNTNRYTDKSYLDLKSWFPTS